MADPNMLGEESAESHGAVALCTPVLLNIGYRLGTPDFLRNACYEF